MENQTEISMSMRYILVDWLVEVHMKFDLLPETFFLTIQLIDRYLAQVDVERGILQLVGVTCLLLASKYHEVYPPLLSDCVYIMARSHTRQEIIEMEMEILTSLDFELSFPTAYPFCQRFLSLTLASRVCQLLANYYLERTVMELAFLNFRPSLVAAAAVCLALNHPEIREKDRSNGFVSSSLVASLFLLQTFCH